MTGYARRIERGIFARVMCRGDLYMIAQTAGVMRRSRASYLAPRAAIKSALSFRWPAITLGAIRNRNAISPFKLAAGTFAWVAATLAIMTCQVKKQETAAIEIVDNEMIVSRQQEQTYSQTEEVEASDDQEGDEEAVPSNYPRVVQTVRFFNPGAPQNIDTTGERAAKGRLNVRTHVPSGNPAYRAEGTASWYGPDFNGRRTANGERYDMHGISAAHRTMPLPSYARVTNLDNGRSIIVRVNNRGPFVHNRIVDLSIGTAKALDFYRKGTARVRVEFVGRAPIEGSDDQMLLATLRAGTPAPVPANVMVASAKPFLPKGSNGKDLLSPTEH
jgi:rare lipoprotein A (peptidoglycan hydrolase)